MTAFSKEIVVILGTGAAALIAAIVWYRCNKQKHRIPEKWVEVGAVSDLWIYPLKSGRGMEVQEFECTQLGPVLLQENKLSLKDRGFLIYSEKDGEQRTARNYSQMVLITVTAITKREIKLDAPDMSSIVINTSIENPKVVPCSLWEGERQQCIDCGNEAAKWISQYCLQKDSGLRLGLCTDWKRSASVEPWIPFTRAYDKLKSEDLGIFSDLSSYLIFNQASVEDLNKKLPAEVSPLNFRPNIIVKGPKAFAEDDWDWIRIGKNVIFRNVRPCTRCIMVNIDPKTGIPDKKVLNKLKEYRQLMDIKRLVIEGDAPVLGIHAGIREPGHIKLGDKVYVG